MDKRSIQIVGLFGIVLFFATAATGQTSPPANTDNAAGISATQVENQDKHLHCPDGIEMFLPGDYYACEARADSGRGKYLAMLQMLEESASWANKDSQYALGLAYFNGDIPGVPQNRPLGLAWLALAAERKNPQYQLAYAIARTKATPEEIHDASILWQRMRLKYGDSVAAPRAVRHFNHAIDPIDEEAMYGGSIWIHGLTPFPVSVIRVAALLHNEASADFDDWRGEVTVGRPVWIKTPPSFHAPQTSGSGNP